MEGDRSKSKDKRSTEIQQTNDNKQTTRGENQERNTVMGTNRKSLFFVKPRNKTQRAKCQQKPKMYELQDISKYKLKRHQKNASKTRKQQAQTRTKMNKTAISVSVQHTKGRERQKLNPTNTTRLW